MSKFIIEKDIPIPKGRYVPTQATYYPLDEMEVGDSFKVVVESSKARQQVKRLASMAFYYKSRYNRQFTVKRIDAKTIRVWRVK